MSRPELRKLLAAEFPEVAAFVAFVRACYPAVYQRLGPSMDRVAITNLLFQCAGDSPAEMAATVEQYRLAPPRPARS